MGSAYAKHQQLVKRVRLALQEAFPEGRSFERHVGVFQTKAGQMIKINRPGMSDIWAVIDGQHFELECKTGSAVLSKPQKQWRNSCQIMGAHFLVVRCEKECIENIKSLLNKTKPVEKTGVVTH
jgi:hypothetical protein